MACGETESRPKTMQAISTLHFSEAFVSAMPVRERVLLLVALVLSTLAGMFYRQLRSLSARSHAHEISRGAAADEPRLDEALVAFVAGSKVSSGILNALAEGSQPLRFKALAVGTEPGSANAKFADVPRSAMRAVLRLLQMARLVRMRGARFSLTPLGRDVQRLITRKVQPLERPGFFSAEAQPALS
jgi:hypothetical protein